MSRGSARAMLALVTGLAAACGERPVAGDDPRADPRDAEIVKLGGKLYAQQCASCHGARLEGQPDWRSRLPNGRLPAPPHDESGHSWHHPDRVLFAITKHGMVPPHAPEGYDSDMPAFGGRLSDGEIWAVLAHIKSHWRTAELLAWRAGMARGSEGR